MLGQALEVLLVAGPLVEEEEDHLRQRQLEGVLLEVPVARLALTSRTACRALHRECMATYPAN